jgi:hypothetical protein
MANLCWQSGQRITAKVAVEASSASFREVLGAKADAFGKITGIRPA